MTQTGSQAEDAGALPAVSPGERWSLEPLREEERPLLARLLELYLYDFSEFTGWNVQEDGLFARSGWHERQWSTPGRHVLLLRVEGKPAGFAIVDERSPLPGGGDRHYVAEFFVMRGQRRRGLGEAVAREIFDRFPGGWQVLQMPQNTAAQGFWRRVIGPYTGAGSASGPSPTGTSSRSSTPDPGQGRVISAPERDLAGKVAIVTGAGSGVGRAIALALAGAGATPVLVGRTRERLEETARLVEEIGGTALVVAADVSDEAAVAGLVERATAELGGVDVLVAAGVGLYGPVESYPLAAWQATLAVNLTGVFLCSRTVLSALRARGGGAILAIASGAGKQGYPNLAAYAASKFGLIGFMQSLAAEVGNEGIKVSTIVPGSILTDFAGGSAASKRSQSEGKRYLEPEDVAEAALYLLRQPARAWTQEMNLWPF